MNTVEEKFINELIEAQKTLQKCIGIIDAYRNSKIDIDSFNFGHRIGRAESEKRIEQLVKVNKELLRENKLYRKKGIF